MPKNIPESELNAAIAELNKVRKNLLKHPDVTAADVGYKIRNGEMTDELAIRIHVKRKLPREAIKEHELLPERLGRFSVDVIEAEYGPQSVAD